MKPTHSCCGVKHVVFSYMHNIIDNPLRICIRCYNLVQVHHYLIKQGLKAKGRWMPPVRCFLTYVVT